MDNGSAVGLPSLASVDYSATWPPPDFVAPPDDKLRCVTCHEVLQQPVQTPCGHRMCKTCLEVALEGHDSVPCPAREEECEMVTLNNIMPDYSVRRELSQLPVHCMYKSAGCDVILAWGKLQTHIDTECSKVTNKFPIGKELIRKVSTLSQENTKLHETIARLEGANQQMKESHQLITEKLTSLEQLVQALTASGGNTSDGGKVREHERRIATLETRGNASNTNNTGNGIELGDACRRHERQIAILDVRQAETDLRMLSIESTNFCGTMVWKISDFTRRKQEAVSGNTLSIFSQPFFTSRYGYKMCARAYLNGDGVGRGTHFSLFFVIMRGEYDNLLDWPFRQKVTLTLLDQTTGRRHLSDTFRPDPNSSSFRKPISDMNVASGCPLFVKQSQIEQTPHLKDDSIFIKVIIDTAELPVS